MKESNGEEEEEERDNDDDDQKSPREEECFSFWQCCWCCVRGGALVPFTPMVPLDEAMVGTTFHLTEDDEQEIASNVRFPFDARAGKVHTCLLFVVEEMHKDTRSVPLPLEHVQDIQSTFGAMTLQPNPVHIATQRLHVFLGICGGQHVMNAWMSDKGRSVFAEQLGQYYALSYVVSVPHTTSTQEAWDTYQKRLSSSQNAPPPIPGKYAI